MHPEEFKLLSNVNPSTTVGFFTVPISGKRKIKSIECFFNWSTVQPSHTGKFVCDVCGKKYTYKRGLHQHKKHECGQEPKYQCPHCPHRTKQKSSLKTHIFIKHS
ncbi:hypothetical protein M8J76_007858 [Diaphorina citri]|nr:hypothetical protein M8J76_007858 [Diaphorina citri]